MRTVRFHQSERYVGQSPCWNETDQLHHVNCALWEWTYVYIGIMTAVCQCQFYEALILQYQVTRYSCFVVKAHADLVTNRMFAALTQLAAVDCFIKVTGSPVVYLQLRLRFHIHTWICVDYFVHRASLITLDMPVNLLIGLIDVWRSCNHLLHFHLP